MAGFSLKGSTALITGATAGIGEAIAETFATCGADLILTGRRRDWLLVLKSKLEADHGIGVRIFDFDVSQRDACEAVAAQIADIPVDILVNNAGLARGLDPVHEADPDDWDVMIDTNIKGLLYITRCMLPGMIARGKGHVLNMGSIAGFEAYKGGVGYCATKHAVKAINTSMKMDLTGTPIRVSMISPGMVDTEFSGVRFKGDTERAARVYEGMTPLTAQDIADIALFIVTRPPHVDIMDVVVYPTAQSSSYLVHREA